MRAYAIDTLYSPEIREKFNEQISKELGETKDAPSLVVAGICVDPEKHILVFLTRQHRETT